MSVRLLVVVPCGRAKIWTKQPGWGATPAAEAYTGAPFVVNGRYAERFGDAWVVLSAKHGFVPPEADIPGPYEVTFKQPATGPVSVGTLREQIAARGLDRFDVVVGLGGKEYRAAIEAAFAGFPLRLVFPFTGLSIGRAMQATKRATDAGTPGFDQTDGSGD